VGTLVYLSGGTTKHPHSK